MAFLLALGAHPDEVLQLFCEHETALRASFFSIENIFTNQTLGSVQALKETGRAWLRKVHLDAEATFEDLQRQIRPRLRLVVFCESDARIMAFDAVSTPQAPVLQALTASAAIPFIFPSPRIDAKTYCDAAAIMPNPLHMAQRAPHEVLAVIAAPARWRASDPDITLPQNISMRCTFLNTLTVRRAVQQGMSLLQVPRPNHRVGVLTTGQTTASSFMTTGVHAWHLFNVQPQLISLLLCLLFYPFYSGPNHKSFQRHLFSSNTSSTRRKRPRSI